MPVFSDRRLVGDVKSGNFRIFSIKLEEFFCDFFNFLHFFVIFKFFCLLLFAFN